jgi:endonuclease YncB( thermonuclease family)
MQIHIPLLAMAAAALIAACSPKPALFADVPAARAPQVMVLEPDALVVDGRHVRLSNAAAPHLAPHANCWGEALAARQVRQNVQGLVAEAREVTVTPTGGTDEDNRILARVTVDGIDLGQTLLADGLAAAPGEPRFDWCGPLGTNIARVPRVAALTRSGG